MNHEYELLIIDTFFNLNVSESNVVCYSEKLTQMSQSSTLSVEDRFCYNAGIGWLIILLKRRLFLEKVLAI